METQAALMNIENFLSSSALDLTIKAILFYIALLWIAMIIWVTKDITNRTNNIIYQVLSILLIIVGTPIFGLFLYLIIRPSKTLMESYYEELEADVLEQEAFIMQLKLEREAQQNPELQQRIPVTTPKHNPKKLKEKTLSTDSTKKKKTEHIDEIKENI